MSSSREPPCLLPYAGAENKPSERHSILRRRGAKLLKSLTDQAEQNSLYGTVSVELTFQRGQIILVRHGTNGTERF